MIGIILYQYVYGKYSNLMLKKKKNNGDRVFCKKKKKNLFALVSLVALNDLLFCLNESTTA